MLVATTRQWSLPAEGGSSVVPPRVRGGAQRGGLPSMDGEPPRPPATVSMCDPYSSKSRSSGRGAQRCERARPARDSTRAAPRVVAWEDGCLQQRSAVEKLTLILRTTNRGRDVPRTDAGHRELRIIAQRRDGIFQRSLAITEIGPQSNQTIGEMSSWGGHRARNQGSALSESDGVIVPPG